MTDSHAGCPLVVDRAPTTMEALRHLPHAAWSLKPEHSITAFMELSTALDDPFDSFSPPDSQPLDTYDATKPCYLFAIPRELRDMISDYTISIGGIQILQTSKKLREEGTDFLYERRSCHLNVDLTNYVPKFSLQKPIADLIQNINIDISIDFHVDPLPWIHNIKLMGKFVGAIISRQTCRVTVLFRNYRNYSFNFISLRALCFLEWVMSHIRTLVSFSLLTVQIENFTTAHPDWLFWSNYMLPIVRKELEIRLGPSNRHENKGYGGQYFEFHPRGY